MSGPKLEMALMTADPTEAGPVAKRLESEGFDGAFSVEGPHDPFFPLVLAAQETQKLELGTGIAVAFARSPMTVAQQAQDLQRIARGRFWLGLGSQIKPHIERRFSMPWSKPAARMREYTLAIRAIWHTWTTGERLDFRGEFYSHTLMTPLFSPGPNPFGDPKIFLAAVGPKMIEVTGEVADGLLIHPLNTPAFLEHDVIPIVERGRANADQKRDFELSCLTIAMVGTNDEELERARKGARAQISFYASTPAYKVALDREGWGDLQPVLNRMSKEGKWGEMAELISDEMLEAIGVCGEPAEVGRKLRKRNAACSRTSLMLYNETEPDAVKDIVAAFHAE